MIQKITNITLLFLLLPFLLFSSQDEIHDFSGKHFLASYLDCDVLAMKNVEGLLQTMDHSVNSSGAAILYRWHHVFPTDGVTVVYTLSESHASIHTYPEYGACFVDLFTCGDHCSAEPFDHLLREYLKPKTVNARQFLRHRNIEEVPYPK
jgi:S-adenosylmethionine decarboxylase